MRDNLLLKIEENTSNVEIDLRQEPAGFPKPTSFIWSKDGWPVTGPVQTYSSVTFATVRREDAGNYAVSATSYALGSTTEQVGSDTGSFFLDVICKLR